MLDSESEQSDLSLRRTCVCGGASVFIENLLFQIEVPFCFYFLVGIFFVKLQLFVEGLDMMINNFQSTYDESFTTIAQNVVYKALRPDFGLGLR